MLDLLSFLVWPFIALLVIAGGLWGLKTIDKFVSFTTLLPQERFFEKVIFSLGLGFGLLGLLILGVGVL